MSAGGLFLDPSNSMHGKRLISADCMRRNGEPLVLIPRLSGFRLIAVV